MNILIVGKSGCGKSNLGDLIRGSIFKSDSNATIITDDPDRSVKRMGQGTNTYNIVIKQEETKEEVETADVVVHINSKAFIEQFRKNNL